MKSFTNNITNKEVAIFQVIDRSLSIHISDQATDGLKIRLHTIYPFFVKALKNLDIDNISFVLDLCDFGGSENIGNLPCICLTKDKRTKHKLIPNIDFFSGLMIKVLNESSNDKPYGDKKNQSFFIGSSTNGLKRLKYCYDLIDDPNHIAKISNFCQLNKDEVLIKFPKIDNCISKHIDIKSQLDYKILVNIDGNSICWSRLYWQMNSNSIPVYIDKQPNNIQYFDNMMNNDCYFTCNFDNYKDVFKYILNESNLNEVERINTNGKNFCKDAFSTYLFNPENFLVNTIKEVITEIKNEKT
jgi:hypothetical protein